MKQCSVTNSSWFTNLKLPNVRGGGYNILATLNNKNSNNPYDWGAPLLNGKQRYKRTVIKKQ